MARARASYSAIACRPSRARSSCLKLFSALCRARSEIMYLSSVLILPNGAIARSVFRQIYALKEQIKSPQGTWQLRNCRRDCKIGEASLLCAIRDLACLAVSSCAFKGPFPSTCKIRIENRANGSHGCKERMMHFQKEGHYGSRYC